MICQNCIHREVCKHKSESVYECEHFKDGTIKNQYDQIRNMSVEEMAEFMYETNENCESFCAFTKDGKCNSFEGGKQTCIIGIREYLESEVTE